MHSPLTCFHPSSLSPQCSSHDIAGAHGPPARPQHNSTLLEITRVDSLVHQYYTQAIAPSTMRMYNSAQLRYRNFCSSMNISLLPIAQSYLCQFVASQGVAHKSIKGYLSAIRHLQISPLGTDPLISGMVVLSYVLQGIKRSQAVAGTNNPRTRLPITAGLMRSLKRHWESQGISFNTSMLWATACVCFFGFLRSGEATVPTQASYDAGVHLSISDVSLDSQSFPSTVMVRIKSSKADPFRVGVTVYLGRTDQELCPVAAVLDYIARRGTYAGPLFIYENGQPLTRNSLVREVRSALLAMGINATRYSGHSFRIGAATSAAAAGVEDAIIKILGRCRAQLTSSMLGCLETHSQMFHVGWQRSEDKGRVNTPTDCYSYNFTSPY